MYNRNKDFWNKVFEKESPQKVGLQELEKHPLEIQAGLRWLCSDANSIIDFGCGNGSLLMQCASLGTQRHMGIDISETGIDLAKQFAKLSSSGTFDFRCGDVTELKNVPAKSVDSAIASNIIDNLTPEDARLAIKQLHRILKQGGKLFFKINTHLSKEQIREWDIKPIRGNFLDDGLYLWNLTTERWKELLLPYYDLDKYAEVYYSKHDQYNRLFLLLNK